jgi:hypothetical protein
MSQKFLDWGSAKILGLGWLEVIIFAFRVFPFGVHTLGSVPFPLLEASLELIS